ncbi:sugar ABC transporter ATP-binding protein [Desertimonas flava]|uniref:sugar ABC transporter ATP-binding protein n=1 Tax=Desertimonas flava TaxID=2064846 RepID=UPI0013C45AE1|nr:sugar ABC transporter ATP-binding protein [Desertimonas flava]
MSAAPPRLVARGLTKSYGGVTVVDGVDLTIEAGEVRALLGENGAGKSTVIKILSGVVRPDDAHVEIDGDPLHLDDPRSAMAHGISTLYQELSIVPGLSVAENALLGHDVPTRLGAIRWRALHARARKLFDDLGVTIDVRADVSSLSPVGRTMTALARALSHDSRLLILDEPTAALTDAESRLLFDAMRRMRALGVAILYVSHRLEEVLEVCDTYSVMRNGQLVAEGDIADASVDGLVAAMAGRPIDAIFPPKAAEPGDVVLRVERLSGPRVTDVGFEVRAGEVLGIAGLAGSGRSEILRMIAGVQPRAGGTIDLHGEPLAPRSVRAGHRRGVALVPQERRTSGLVPSDIERNVNLTTVARHTYGAGRGGAGRLAGAVMSRARSRRHATRLAEQLDLRYRSLTQPVLTLSGGNQQKVVLAKFLALHPDVLLLDEPTRGVDVATKSQIYRLIEERAAAGAAVVVVSSELPELLGLTHRILVMHEGASTGTFATATTTEHDLLLACYGRKAS